MNCFVISRVLMLIGVEKNLCAHVFINELVSHL